jgi:hypothetical protein
MPRPLLFAPPPSLAQQVPDHILHSVGPHVVCPLTWAQVSGHKVLREGSPVIEKAPAEVQEKNMLAVDVEAKTIIDGLVQPAERVIRRGTAWSAWRLAML